MNWSSFPYHRKPYADSTLRNMSKSELIQIIRDYEHNYHVLWVQNERGIAACQKLLEQEGGNGKP